MKIQDNIGKISWSLADKLLFIGYGVVTLFQVNVLPLNDWAIFGTMLSINIWIFTIGESFALNSLIQFGMNLDIRKKVNLIGLVVFIMITVGSSMIIYISRSEFAMFFHNPRLSLIGSYLPLLILSFIPRSFCLKLIFRDQKMFHLFLVNLSYFGTMTIFTIFLIFRNHSLILEDMITINILGSLTSSLMAILLTFNNLVFGLEGNYRVINMIKFGAPMIVITLLHSIPRQLDVLAIQFFFNTEIVGYYYSAKTLYRVFDEVINAASGFIYPLTVKYKSNQDHTELKALMTKSVSFIFFFFLVIFIFLEFGISDLIINYFLPIKYQLATKQFDVLLWSLLFSPFMLLGNVILGCGEIKANMTITILSLFISCIAFTSLYFINDGNLSPIGLVSYNAAFGIFSYIFSYKHFGFKPIEIFRVIKDTRNFVNKKFKLTI
ncbi:MAG: oligosaccharide flippase family protein [Candidatus Kapabacteria bacterium]|nr:oligosaccharide flippase family protein [Candidatus Kapabacteria bacterium]